MVVRAGDRVDELARAVCEGRDRATLEQACESIDRAVVAATTETDSGETHTPELSVDVVTSVSQPATLSRICIVLWA